MYFDKYLKEKAIPYLVKGNNSMLSHLSLSDSKQM